MVGSTLFSVVSRKVVCRLVWSRGQECAVMCGLLEGSVTFNGVYRKGLCSSVWSRGRECAVQFGLEEGSEHVQFSVVERKGV